MARGFNSAGDLITTLVDGTDVNTIWNEHNQVLRLHNDKRDALKDFLAFNTTQAGEEVLQVGSLADFELATEYGEPVGARVAPDKVVFGSDFAWKDLALRYTWMFLANAARAELEARTDIALEADNRQVFNKIMQALFNGNANRVNAEGLTVFGLYNGDGMVPPASEGNTFTGTHTHYLASGAAVVDGVDLADMLDHIVHHGYPGQLLIFANPREMRTIRGFRAGVGTPVSPYDFIPSAGAPAYLSAAEIIGDRAPARVGRIKIEGSFGPAWVSEQPLIPAGYLLAVASDGPNSAYNPVSFRQHPTAALQGLRLVKGRTPDYPLIDSFYLRGFGTGVRHRGAAVVMQITPNAAYTAPATFLAA